jgi:hypothetical protein
LELIGVGISQNSSLRTLDLSNNTIEGSRSVQPHVHYLFEFIIPK